MTAAATDHRQRLLNALGLILAEKSYRDVTLTDITGAAHVSRRSFYEHFKNKDDCLLSLARDTSQRVMQSIITSYSPGDNWPDVVEKVTGAYLDFVDNHPSLMYALYIEVAVLGQNGLELRRDIAGTFARFLSTHTVQRVESGELSQIISEAEATALVAGINELILHRLMEKAETHVDTRQDHNGESLRAIAQRLILRMTQ